MTFQMDKPDKETDHKRIPPLGQDQRGRQVSPAAGAGDLAGKAPEVTRHHTVRRPDFIVNEDPGEPQVLEVAQVKGPSFWAQLDLRRVFLLFAALFLSEMILRLNVSGPFFNLGLLYIGLFSFMRAFILSAFMELLPPRAKQPVLMGLFILFPFIFSTQLVYYKFFRTFMVFYSIGQGGQVLQFLEDIIVKILRNMPWILLFFLPMVIYLAFLRDKRPPVESKPGRWRRVLAGLLVALLILAMTLGIMATNRSYNSPWEHYFLENEILTGTNQFGLITAMWVDLSHLAYPRSALIPEDLIPDPIETLGPTQPTDTEPTDSPETEAPDPGPETYPNSLPIDFETRLGGYNPDESQLTNLLGKTREELIQYLDLVFSRTQPSYTNDHTGKGKGFNLIFVTAESWSKYTIDEELTPTLWMMYNQGVKFEHFYCPVWTVSTLDGEYAGLCGMIPKQGVWTLKEAYQNDMAMVPGKMLSRLGYTCNAWHNHTWNYYSRDMSHPNLGYDYRGLGHGLDVVPTWPESDLEMIEKTAFEFVDQEPFHVYYLTVSGHANWTRLGNAMSSRHWDHFSHLDLPDEAIAYLAANYELELAMESLLNQLREAGVADRTLIVVNPDHYPYAMQDHASYEALAGKKLDKVFDIYESTALFYYDGIEPEVVDKYCTSLDLLPTIYNYMGIPYDSRFLSGRDIFSDTEGLAIFLGRSWITEEGRYDAQTAIFTPHEGRSLDDEKAYVDRINREVKLRYDTARLIIDTDYYEDLLTEDEWADINADYITYMKENPWP